MKKIIEIEMDLVQVVPVDPATQMAMGFAYADAAGAPFSHIGYEAMLAAVPADLPGVVEHSGKPSAYSLLDQGCRTPDDCEDFERLAYAGELTPQELHKFESAGRATPLFTHPPAQPDTAALQARIAELEAQIAAQAGQEPVGEVVMFGADLKEISWAKGKMPAFGAKLYTAPPAPTNTRSIVQAALKAAANVCDEAINRWGYENVRICAQDIRAIAPQTIIDAARGK